MPQYCWAFPSRLSIALSRVASSERFLVFAINESHVEALMLIVRGMVSRPTAKGINSIRIAEEPIRL